MIFHGFPTEKDHMPEEISQFWEVEDPLDAVDGVDICDDHIVVPLSVQKQNMENLHSAHQGVTSWAKSTVYWPGITSSKKKARGSYHTHSVQRGMIPPFKINPPF